MDSPVTSTALSPVQPRHHYSPVTITALSPIQPRHQYSPVTSTAPSPVQPQLDVLVVLVNPQRMREGYSSQSCLSVCIYSRTSTDMNAPIQVSMMSRLYS